MDSRKRVLCPDNEVLASCLLEKRKELADSPKGLSDNLDMTLSKAYTSVCSAKTPIKTLKDFSQLKGIGNWMLKQMQRFFKDASVSPEPEDLTVKGMRGKAKKRYVPQKNSCAYALLITLYRGTSNGKEFMRKQELIDAAEVSELSQKPIAPEKGKGKKSHFGSSSREWYSGWSCMKTLVLKGLVVKSSSPAKYMLTQEGEDVAKECLARSRMPDPVETFAGAEDSSNMDINYIADDESDQLQPTPPEVTVRSEDLSGQERSLDVPPQSLERFLHMGYSKEQVFDAFIEVSKTSGDKDISALWPAVLCHLREEQIYGLRSETQTSQNDCQLESTTVFPHGQVRPCGSQSSQMGTTWDHTNRLNACPTTSSINLRGCSPNLSNLDVPRPNMSVLRMPPLGVGERFEDAYEVLLVLDDREQFAIHGSSGYLLEMRSG
ncbi:Crossover junction endonuclease MUS81 [Linum grandiflorum]